jgi:hypothetical protein
MRSSAAPSGPSARPALSRHKALRTASNVRAVLKSERQYDRGIACIRVALVSRFMVVQKKFAYLAIGEPAHGRREAQAGALEREGFARASIRRPHAFAGNRLQQRAMAAVAEGKDAMKPGPVFRRQLPKTDGTAALIGIGVVDTGDAVYFEA